MSQKSSAGRIGEDIAALFLTLKGYQILRRNLRTRTSEIDIVARGAGCLVFVEVKLRGRGGLSGPLECVDVRKRARISRGALSFLQSYPEDLYRMVRIDVVSVSWSREELVVQHIENAFPAEGLSVW
ncbi:MAG: YraN family protein [Candidatus Eiseniibacteriota bacterium]|nr:MAG: YraN family protein [Candidatus Eisenbacteria bacterium]